MKAVMAAFVMMSFFSVAHAELSIKTPKTCHLRDSKKLEQADKKINYSYLLNDSKSSQRSNRATPAKSADGVRRS